MKCSGGTKIMRHLKEERRSFANHLQLDRFMLIQWAAYVRVCVYSRRWSGQGMVTKGWYKHCKPTNNKQQNQYRSLTAVWSREIEKCSDQWTQPSILWHFTQSLFTAAYVRAERKEASNSFSCLLWKKYIFKYIVIYTTAQTFGVFYHFMFFYQFIFHHFI